MAERTIGLRLKIDGVEQTITTIKELESTIKTAQEKLNSGGVIGSKAYERLSNEISQANTQLSKLRQQTEGLTLEKQLEGFGKFTGGITAGFAAASAAAQLFGNETEDISKAATTAMNLLTLATGARAAAETIAGAKIVATTIATKAQTIATNLSTISLRTLYATMAANPIGAIIAAIGLLVTAFIAFSEETEDTTKAQRELNKVTSEEAVKLQALNKVLINVNSTNEERLGAINELKKAYPGFNAFIDKENRLTKDGVKFVEAKTKALITQAQINKILEKIAENNNKKLEIQNRTLDESLGFWDKVKAGVIGLGSGYGQLGSQLSKIESAAKNTAEATAELDKESGKLQQSLNGLLGQQQKNNETLDEYNKKLEEQAEKEKQTADAAEAAEKRKAALDANQKRRNELLKTDLQRKLADLELSYKQEVESAKKNGEDLLLVDKVFIQRRGQLFEEYKQQFIQIQNETYAELNKITTGSYLVEEAALKRSQQRQREELEKFEQDLIVIAGKSIKNAEDSTKKESDILIKAKEKEAQELKNLNDKRSLLEAQIEQGRTKAIQDNAREQLKILEDNYNKATFAKFAAEENLAKAIANKSKIDTTKIQTEEERIRKQFRETRAQQELLFEAQLEIQRKQVILDGIKSVNDILNLEDADRLNANREVYLAEFELFTENEKRKIRAGVESTAILNKNGQEFTEQEKVELEKLVQSYLNSYDAIAEIVKNNAIKRMEASKQIAAIDKQLNTERLESEKSFTEEYTKLQSELMGEKSLEKREEILKKIEILELEHALNLLAIEKQKLKDKLAILALDPTLNKEEYEQIQKAIYDIDKVFAQKSVDLEEKKAKLQEKNANQLSQKTLDAIKKAQAYIAEFEKLLSGVSSAISQSFSYQLQALEADYEKSLEKIADNTEEGLAKRREAETIYLANKKKLEKEAQIASLQIQIAQATASVAQSVLSVLAAPPPVGGNPILQGILIAANVGIGLAQISTINKSLGLVQSMARGGFLRGPSHEQGGIKYQGGGVELEGNESIINRRSTLAYAPLLSQINMQGGGRPIYVNSVMDSRMAEVLASVKSEPIRAYVLEQDITKSQAVNRRLEELASY